MSNRYCPIRIAIADDHKIFRDGFKILLKGQDDLELIGEAENGNELLELVAKFLPDIAIVDIMMPEMDGIKATKMIRAGFPQTRVIALSMFNDDNLVMDMLDAGAKGYLLKNTNKDELLKAVITVQAGDTYFCSETSEKLARMIAESKINPFRNYPAKKFTPREKEILSLICKQYSNKEIATMLDISIRTVETHRQKIQDKTGAKNSIGVVIYAIKNELFQI